MGRGPARSPPMARRSKPPGRWKLGRSQSSSRWLGSGLRNWEPAERSADQGRKDDTDGDEKNLPDVRQRGLGALSWFECPRWLMKAFPGNPVNDEAGRVFCPGFGKV